MGRIVKRIEDGALAKRVRAKKCNKSLKELIQRHSPLCYDIYKKYSPAMMASGVCIADIYGEKDYIVYKSAVSYDPTKKTKFSTWLGNQVRYYCLNLINNNKYVQVEDENLDFFVDQKTEEDKKEVSGEVDYIFNLLGQLQDKRIKKIFKLRYFDHDDKNKMPWVKVAEKLKVSTQTAINLHNKGAKIVCKKIKSKCLSDFL
jgi:RNA polymerase sigma factor (sigma-70 family)